MQESRNRRNTRQRQVILEELCSRLDHPTALGLFEAVRRRLPGISLATVYRNLELLAEMGLVRKLELAGAQARFDGDVSPHDHVRCVHCGRLDDLHGVPLELPPPQAHDWGGYRILGRRLELLGVCPACQTTHTSQ